MLGPQLAALGETAAGEDVSVGRAHVAFVRTVLSYAVEEVSDREDVLVFGQLEYDHPVSYAVAVAKKHAEEAAAPALQLRDA